MPFLIIEIQEGGMEHYVCVGSISFLRTVAELPYSTKEDVAQAGRFTEASIGQWQTFSQGLFVRVADDKERL